ncbi:uncharacterized protein VP01_1372g2 [Puccinia sorghi]|uniref:Uncharacterized protein n=1 Tax=Puccinia sorghi TaxID=27349 RepID=A0A0L6VNH2_9BASI|nr:uncharacterized protein VP01_1372g2 [Puccinia sorghi]
MDSLHPSLSQALPLRDYDAEQALQAPFRAAALGIATFYKKASENGRKAYSLGYSSALQDVLAHLQTALDQLDSQNSQESMALTIQRIVDYIQRRQDALRAESQEPNEDDNPQPSPAPQHANHRQSVTPTSHSSTLSPTDQQAQPQAQPQPTHTSQPTPHEPASSAASASPVDPPTRRRTSPRKMTPLTFHPSPQPHAQASDFGLAPTSSSPPSTNGPSRQQPFNLNFSSFAASPLPQHQQSSSTNNNTNTSSSSSSSRRHRGGPTEVSRKGKLKERAGTSASSTLESTGLFPHGYAHYGPNPTSSSSGDTRALSSLIGNKRRFPTECALSDHDSPVPVAPQPVRITRRTNIPPKQLATPVIEDSNNNPIVNPATPNPHETQITLHHHHHRDQDDVLMLLQGSNELDDQSIERASKRFFSCKKLY